MVNIDLNLNSYGKSIASIIVLITFLIGLIIILDEFINISIFCYKYTYLYNYGNLNSNICKNDAIEYESARYKIYSELNKYKLIKDLFNKNWINFGVYIIIFISTILVSIAFGCLFYYLFIKYNDTCTKPPTDDKDFSFLKLMMKCFCGSCHNLIPNCTVNYFMVIILLVIYPLIYIFKFLFNFDMSINSTFIIKIFHIGFFIMLLYYLLVLFTEEELTQETDENFISQKYQNMLIYSCFIITFIASNFIFDDYSNKYNDVSKISNLYNNPDDKNDTNFFDLYKQEEPTKPIEPSRPMGGTNKNEDLLLTFKYCKDNTDATCNNDLYKANANKLKDYYIKKKIYDNELKNYNYKYNIIKTNEINIPEKITVLYNMMPKLLGFENYNTIYLYILAIVIFVCYLILKMFESKNANYLYNTIFIYTFSILLILVLSNAVLTYNTYLNKFLIYEPIVNYKNDINNANNMFNIILNKEVPTTANSLISFYNYTTNKNLNLIGIGSMPSTTVQRDKSIDENIDDILNNDISLITPTKTQTIINNNTYLKEKMAVVLLSSMLNYNALNNNVNSVNDLLTANNIKNFEKIISYTISTDKNLIYYKSDENFFNDINGISTINNDIKAFFIIIQNMCIGNINNIDKVIDNLKDNYKYFIYKLENPDRKFKITDNITKQERYPNNGEFFNNFLKTTNISESELKLLDYNDSTNRSCAANIGYYKKNKFIINNIFNIYKNFLLKFRSLIIEMFNGAINCDNSDNINIDIKLKEYLKVICSNSTRTKHIKDYVFKTPNQESKINLYIKLLTNTIAKFNVLMKNYINAIIYLFDKILETPTTDSTDSLLLNTKSDIISNYNFFNDESKHNSSYLIDKPYIIKCKYSNKYNNITSKNLSRIKLNSNSVSYSFIILNIIFAIVLLEPKIINS